MVYFIFKFASNILLEKKIKRANSASPIFDGKYMEVVPG